MLAADTARRWLSQSGCLSVASRALGVCAGFDTNDAQTQRSRASYSALASTSAPNSALHQFHVSRRSPLNHGPAFLAGTAVVPLATCQHQQSRAFSWQFWKKEQPEVSLAAVEEQEPPIDLDLVDTIVGMSTDAASWEMIHQGVWYNTYAAQLLLQSVHDTFGYTWLAAIPITCVIMRTAMAPFIIEQQRTAFNHMKARPYLAEAGRKMAQAMERGKSPSEAQAQYGKDVKEILKTYKTSMFATLYPALVQLPVMTGYYFGLTSMCAGALPSLITEGLPLGFDFAHPDPWHALNLAVPATMTLQIYLGMGYQLPMMSEQQQKVFKYGLWVAPPLFTLLFWNFPAALCYYWTCSNIYSILLELLLRIPLVRRAVNLPSRRVMIDTYIQHKAQGLGDPLQQVMAMYNSGAKALEEEKRAAKLREADMQASATRPVQAALGQDPNMLTIPPGGLASKPSWNTSKTPVELPSNALKAGPKSRAARKKK